MLNQETKSNTNGEASDDDLDFDMGDELDGCELLNIGCSQIGGQTPFTPEHRH